MALHSAEVWVTNRADLVVTIPYSEHDLQSETEMRERLYRCVTHRFHDTERDILSGYLRSTKLDTLQIIEDPDFHPNLQYGVVLVRNGVPA